MTKTELARLAAMGHALRPDWPAQSLLTLLSKNLPYNAYRDVAVALAYVATDDDTTSPARLLQAGPWWLVTAPVRSAGLVFTPPLPAVDPDDVSAYLEGLRTK